MLYIHFGHLGQKKEVVHLDMYFDNLLQRDTHLVDNDFARKVLLDVEGTKVISNYVIETKYIGIVSSEKISGGVKALLLMKACPDIVINASRCGDNCAKWIQQIGREQDLTVTMYAQMEFSNPFEAVCVNTGKKLNSVAEYDDAYIDWRIAENKKYADIDTWYKRDRDK